MGIHEEAKACKLEKSSSPPPEQEQEQQQTSVHVYPDWAAMQAYYGPTMAVPPYFNSAAASGHGPRPYMWGPPQHMMPLYAAFYPHGGVYAPPGAPLATSPPNIDSPAKSSGNSDRGLMKKLKGFGGLAMSIGNANGDGAEGGNDNGISHSGEAEGSSEGSDGNTTERGQNGRKRSQEGSPTPPAVGKTEPQSSQLPCIEADGASNKMKGLVVTSAGVSGKVVGGGVSANPSTELNLKNSPSAAANMTSTTVTLTPNEALLQNNRELKGERRKQSDRESTRRSRLRKQAETEELALKVETLNSENLTLTSEIKRLTDNSEKLRLQNAKLVEKLKNAQKERVMENPRHEKGLSLSTANFLSRVDNNTGSVVRNDGEGELYDNNKNPDSAAKLHQLLAPSPRADAVAAG